MHPLEQRRTKRFSLQLPVAVTRAGAQRTARAGHTRNISSGGVLFTSEAALDIGGPIEYVITLAETSVSLRCVGKVIRYQKISDSSLNGNHAFEVAATLE